MVVTIAEHFKLHQRRHKKNGTRPVTFQYFKIRYNRMIDGEYTYKYIIEAPSKLIEAKKVKNQLTLSGRCRSHGVDYQKVWRVLLKTGLTFEDWYKEYSKDPDSEQNKRFKV